MVEYVWFVLATDIDLLDVFLLENHQLEMMFYIPYSKHGLIGQSFW